MAMRVGWAPIEKAVRKALHVASRALRSYIALERMALLGRLHSLCNQSV